MKGKLIVIVIAAVVVAAIVLMFGGTKEGSSGVVDGTRWPSEADARRMVQEATR